LTINHFARRFNHRAFNAPVREMIRRALIFLTSALLAYTGARGQDTTGIVVPGTVIDGDTLPLINLNSYMVFPPYNVTSRRAAMRYDKLIYNVKKVYPYAKLAGIKLNEYKLALDTIHDEKARKAFIKKAEEELEAQFGDEIRDLTFSQGKVLIKLIYRETGNSTHEIVRELRGKFTAFIWQTMAKIFGYDLKAPFDPRNDPNDAAIERIVLLIEAGSI
jgi:hypothetical protein